MFSSFQEELKRGEASWLLLVQAFYFDSIEIVIDKFTLEKVRVESNKKLIASTSQRDYLLLISIFTASERAIALLLKSSGFDLGVE
jgi:hypothetical protein